MVLWSCGLEGKRKRRKKVCVLLCFGSERRQGRGRKERRSDVRGLDKVKVETSEEERDGGDGGTIGARVFVEFKEGNGNEIQVLGHKDLGCKNNNNNSMKEE